MLPAARANHSMFHALLSGALQLLWRRPALRMHRLCSGVAHAPALLQCCAHACLQHRKEVWGEHACASVGHNSLGPAQCMKSVWLITCNAEYLLHTQVYLKLSHPFALGLC
jgi:hypothetical protein